MKIADDPFGVIAQFFADHQAETTILALLAFLLAYVASMMLRGIKKRHGLWRERRTQGVDIQNRNNAYGAPHTQGYRPYSNL